MHVHISVKVTNRPHFHWRQLKSSPLRPFWNTPESLHFAGTPCAIFISSTYPQFLPTSSISATSNYKVESGGNRNNKRLALNQFKYLQCNCVPLNSDTVTWISAEFKEVRRKSKRNILNSSYSHSYSRPQVIKVSDYLIKWRTVTSRHPGFMTYSHHVLFFSKTSCSRQQRIDFPNAIDLTRQTDCCYLSAEHHRHLSERERPGQGEFSQADGDVCELLKYFKHPKKKKNNKKKSHKMPRFRLHPASRRHSCKLNQF